MHLLMETAIGDSKGYGVLSYEELEELKRERTMLFSRIEATRRKLALESKLRDAAQSLNRLYSTQGRRESSESNLDKSPTSPKKHRRSFLGSRNSNAETISRTDDEFAASTRKCEELSNEMSTLEKRLEEVQRKILEHTAGVLQMTHRGLKKNIRRGELPRSPESMMSTNHQSIPAFDGISDFDERSFYRTNVFDEGGLQGPGNMLNGNSPASIAQVQALNDAEQRLKDVNTRLRDMVLRADPEEKREPPPLLPSGEGNLKPEIKIQEHLGYLAVGLDAIEAHQARTLHDAQASTHDAATKLEDINVRLRGMLERTSPNEQAPVALPLDSQGKGLQAQFALAMATLDRLNQRLDLFMEQKEILGRQIQQQRDLNFKSDAQKDAQIRELTDEIEDARRLHTIAEREEQSLREQVNLLMEQIDAARQEAALAEQKHNVSSNNALQAEKEARRQAEADFRAQLKSQQDQYTQLQADMARLQENFDRQTQSHLTMVNDLTKAKESADIEIQRCHAEMKDLESEVVRAQTDLTIVRAELDGAYGTRAQRAADVSMNPAIQKEIDDLNDDKAALQRQIDYLKSEQQNAGASSEELQAKLELLQKELKETIEDYEVMTRASIEFEKERDQLESQIDSLRERGEALEAQLSDEKLKWLGMKNGGPGQGGPTESTSTMVLKNEFKKMMRDTRAENMKALRVGHHQVSSCLDADNHHRLNKMSGDGLKP
jgi:chromosome segregation ATPase